MEWECCWIKREIGRDECPQITEGEEELFASRRRRLVEKCLECPRFAKDLARLREDGDPLAELLPIISDEFFDQKAQLQSLVGFLNSKTREIKFLHELSVVLQTSIDLDEVLSVAMTAITAGKGFGMNRAFLLMTDKERQSLRGYLGVGPLNSNEAWQIWQDVDRQNLSLRELARLFQKNKLSSEKVKFHDILEKLVVPLKDHRHIFNRALRERKLILAEHAFQNADVDPALAQLLGVDNFLVMPLISRNRRIGVIIADNCVTRKPITPQDMQSLETFAFPVAFALERASLYERLQEEIDKLRVANEKLKEQQELIVRMEKMALVGRITSSIAHSIRNPLLIIGGFARSLLRNMEPADQKREHLETIVREAKQLEDVLEEVLNYSDSLYPARDRWDVNQLLEVVSQDLATRLEERGVKALFELAEELPSVYVDYRQIAYCVRTIITTVLETVVGLREIAIRSRRNEEAVIIEIAADGVPLTPEQKEALLTPFGATQELGVGMGLPLCKTILEKHGAPFEIDTPPDGGTRYIIKLPIKEDT